MLYRLLLCCAVLVFTHCKSSKPTTQTPVSQMPAAPPIATAEQRKLDDLHAMSTNSLVDLTKDRAQIIKILKAHGSSRDLSHHLETADEFVMHYLIFPLRVAVVAQPDKPKFLTKKEIQQGVDILNEGLVGTWVQFKIVEIDTIFESQTINSLRENGYEKYFQFSAKHDLRDTCTLYLVDNEENLCQDFACARTQGFANILVSYTNNVVLDKFFIDDRKVIVHEFGHYFGLYHTAETRFGLEKVDGSNCQTAGDQICDTPADPGELYNVYVNYTGCRMAGFREEGTGLEYRPQINNFMSYYHPCYMKKFVFTPGQLEVMFRAAIWFRQNQIIELGEVPLFP